MNSAQIMSAVESRDDRLQQAIDDAVLAADDADTAARYETSCPEVLERMAEKFTPIDERVFMRALRQGDKQSLGLLLNLVQEAFEGVVAEKKRAILEAKS